MDIKTGKKTVRSGERGERKTRFLPKSRGPENLRKTLISMLTTLALVAATMGILFFGVGAGCVAITKLSKTQGYIGDEIHIQGIGFGDVQGDSKVVFYNNVEATAMEWSNAKIVTTVPVGAETGQVYVQVGGNRSNLVQFAVLESQRPELENVYFSRMLINDDMELRNQRLSFDCRDKDGDLAYGRVWIRLTGDPVTNTSWFSFHAADFGIGSGTDWQYNRSCYIFAGSDIRDRIDLSKEGTITAYLYLMDGLGHSSPVKIAHFMVSPKVYFYVYADFTWGGGIPQAFVEIYPLGDSPTFYTSGHLYGMGSSITFEGEIPLGQYRVHFHNLGGIVSGGTYRVGIGNAYDQISWYNGYWEFSLPSLGYYFTIDSVNGRVIE